MKQEHALLMLKYPLRIALESWINLAQNKWRTLASDPSISERFSGGFVATWRRVLKLLKKKLNSMV
jgi:hypothetical protein